MEKRNKVLNLFLIPFKEKVFRYFDFKGTTARKDCWITALFDLLVLIVCLLMENDTNHIGTTLLGFYAIFSFIPFLAIIIRRLRDAGAHWIWFLLLFFGETGNLILFILLLHSSGEFAKKSYNRLIKAIFTLGGNVKVNEVKNVESKTIESKTGEEKTTDNKTVDNKSFENEKLEIENNEKEKDIQIQNQSNEEFNKELENKNELEDKSEMNINKNAENIECIESSLSQEESMDDLIKALDIDFRENIYISNELKKQAKIRDGFKCSICKKGSLENAILDVCYIVPRFKGGRNELNNLQVVCRDCLNKVRKF